MRGGHGGEKEKDSADASQAPRDMRCSSKAIMKDDKEKIEQSGEGGDRERERQSVREE